MRFFVRKAAIVCLVFLITPAVAESLSERRSARDKAETVEIEVACGKPDKENCAIVVPELSSKTVANGVRLKPLESRGSAESLAGLCDGDVVAAVVQADVLARRASQPDCVGAVALLGAPLYPYQGFMIVRADARESKFVDMLANLKGGAVLRIAAGGPGSGGELTFRNLLAANPEWKQQVDLQPDGAATALNKLRDHQLDAFFVMDGPQSPLLQDVRDTVDPGTKQRVFKFVDARPNEKLLSLQFANRLLYATATIEPGWFSAIKTVSTPAVFAVREDFYRNEPAAAAKIRQAIEDAQAAIASRAGARGDWRKEFER